MPRSEQGWCVKSTDVDGVPSTRDVGSACPNRPATVKVE